MDWDNLNREQYNVYAEVDLEMKAKALAKCEIKNGKTKKPWRKNPGLMDAPHKPRSRPPSNLRRRQSARRRFAHAVGDTHLQAIISPPECGVLVVNVGVGTGAQTPSFSGALTPSIL